MAALQDVAGQEASTAASGAMVAVVQPLQVATDRDRVPESGQGHSLFDLLQGC